MKRKFDISPEALAEELLGRPFDELEVAEMKFGDRAADRVAAIGGSWGFIIAFLALMALWMVLNVTHFLGADFDPFPFILLNLSLSTLAALQAPIILMSQNRQAK